MYSVGIIILIVIAFNLLRESEENREKIEELEDRMNQEFDSNDYKEFDPNDPRW
jgi:hypothetical protein